MENQFLKIGEHWKRCFYFPAMVISHLLHLLVLNDEFVNWLLNICQRYPDHQVCLQRKFLKLQRPFESFSTNNFENLGFRSSQEVILVQSSQILAQFFRNLFLCISWVLQQTFLNLTNIIHLELIIVAKYSWLHKVEYGPKLRKIILQRSTTQDDSMSFDFQAGYVSSKLSVFILRLVALVHHNYVVSHVC